jgi:hypothetical protein
MKIKNLTIMGKLGQDKHNLPRRVLSSVIPMIPASTGGAYFFLGGQI